MTKQEKIEFVDALLEGIRERMVENIEDGSFPEEYEGTFLRAYLAYIANEYVHFIPMTKKEKKDFNNTVLVNNL